jgi:hypothetical protein
MFIDGLDHINEKLTNLALEWIRFCNMEPLNFVGVNEFIMFDKKKKAAGAWRNGPANI